MNIGKYIIGNLFGTILIALLGLLMGAFISWIAGFFLPESAKPIIAGIVFVLFMLGVPSIWVSNWNRMKLVEAIEECEL